jgi:prevent-host-death family protein
MEIPAGEFKAHCLKLMDEVRDNRTSIVITKHGKPVAKLVPFEDEAPSLYGYLQNSVTVKGDITVPVDTVWEAND